ncbi:hypothetical protein WR25_19269 [Diploscapter pachys]|uniref:Mos1 transposase HTH domain-containing protein n=1 Tax=Diploscapter pachys TaxID=2018661 RepID=A0A2A2LB15_9BILA|nr:hypothetical protein WR25_19269 [Diploscapter pachys]
MIAVNDHPPSKTTNCRTLSRPIRKLPRENWRRYSELDPLRQRCTTRHLAPTRRRAANAAEAEPHQLKHLLFVWWNAKGSIYYKLFLASRTATATIYVDQLQKLVDAIREKRLRRSIVHFLHDNARLHVASGTHQKTTKLGWHPVIHSSYSPGLAPSDYQLFRPLKLRLQERKIDKYDDLKTAVNNFFASQSPKFWAKSSSDLPNRWARVTDLNGEYIVDYWWF